MGPLESIVKTVRTKVSPSGPERKRVERIANRLVEGLREALQGSGVEVRLEGSVAHDTWLRGEADIDIFLRFSTSFNKEELRSECLRVSKFVLKGPIIERYAEHPYVESFIGSSRINIVPAYKTEIGKWKSATDRTPFHTDYMRKHLNPKLCDEVRVFKRFLKGIDAYGAEVKIGGFSGMLSQILVLHYGSFRNVLDSASKWKPPLLIDIEGHYNGKVPDAMNYFDKAFIVVDPVDPRRNVAAATRHEKLWEFAAASRAFLAKPGLSFFYPSRMPASRLKLVRRMIATHPSDIVGLEIGRVDAVVDVLWSQLFKLENSLARLLTVHGFRILRSKSWSNETDRSMILFELDSEELPPARLHEGPPIARIHESQQFLEKHTGNTGTVSGPWIEGGRWKVEKVRHQRSALALIQNALKNSSGKLSMPEILGRSARKRARLLLNSQLVPFAEKDREFGRFLFQFLAGRPSWLSKSS